LFYASAFERSDQAEYTAVKVMTAWTQRNLRIALNLWTAPDADDERVLAVYGASHRVKEKAHGVSRERNPTRATTGTDTNRDADDGTGEPALVPRRRVRLVLSGSSPLGHATHVSGRRRAEAE
jgi:hypothetical protein